MSAAAKHNRVWCGTSEHTLAWVEMAGTEPTVCAQLLAPGAGDGSPGQLAVDRFDRARLYGDPDDPLATLSVEVGCRCGRYSVDLIAVLENHNPIARKVRSDFPGVSWSKPRRHKG